MFNGVGGVPSSAVDYHHHRRQFHQDITSSSISSTAARIIIPNNNINNSSSSSSNNNYNINNSSSSNNMMLQTTQQPPPSPIAIHHHQSNSSSTAAISSSPANLNNTNFLSFDHPILFTPPHPLIPTNIHLFHHHHQPPASNLRPPPPTHHHHDQEVMNNDHHMITKEQDEDSWSNDEVKQLFKIKSTTLIVSTTSTTATGHQQHDQSSSWFRPPDDHFHTWDHVSRKLAEMGYKKSAEKCKDKFEEETCRSFGGGYNTTTTTSSDYLIAEELGEHLYSNNDTHGQNSHPPVPVHESPDHNVIDHEQVPQVDDEKEGGDGNLEPQGQKDHFDKDPPAELRVETTQDDDEVAKKSKKRKRKHKKFKMVKGLCVELVNRMMAHQEEMHRKLLQDMAIWEEAWRTEELDRVQREIQIREQEHEMAINRQSTITEFLNKITSFDQIPSDINLQDLYNNIATSIERPIHSSGTTKTPSAVKFTGNRNQNHLTTKDDLGKRWPRDEVLALINMRSKVNSGIGGNSEEHQGNDKGGGSLWERISQGMSEVGYKRSAKRCKEKWENINKYFRKTKDANKKRSLDSRTCPYYHELNKLYNQEKLASDETENCPRPTITPVN